jgi:hypothetical protein
MLLLKKQMTEYKAHDIIAVQAGKIRAKKCFVIGV